MDPLTEEVKRYDIYMEKNNNIYAMSITKEEGSIPSVAAACVMHVCTASREEGR